MDDDAAGGNDDTADDDGVDDDDDDDDDDGDEVDGNDDVGTEAAFISSVSVSNTSDTIIMSSNRSNSRAQYNCAC